MLEAELAIVNFGNILLLGVEHEEHTLPFGGRHAGISSPEMVMMVTQMNMPRICPSRRMCSFQIKEAQPSHSRAQERTVSVVEVTQPYKK